MKAWMGGRKRKLGMERKSEVAQQRQFFAQRREERQRAATKGSKAGGAAGASRPPPIPSRGGRVAAGNAGLQKAPGRDALGRDIAGLKPPGHGQNGVIEMNPWKNAGAEIAPRGAMEEKKRPFPKSVRGRVVEAPEISKNVLKASLGQGLDDAFLSQGSKQEPLNSFDDHSFLSNAVNRRLPPGVSAEIEKPEKEASERKTSELRADAPSQSVMKSGIDDRCLLSMESVECFDRDPVGTLFPKGHGLKSTSRPKARPATPISAPSPRGKSEKERPSVESEPLTKTADESLLCEETETLAGAELDVEAPPFVLPMAVIEPDGFNAGVQELEETFIGQPEGNVGLFGRKRTRRTTKKIPSGKKTDVPASEAGENGKDDEKRLGGYRVSTAEVHQGGRSEEEGVLERKTHADPLFVEPLAAKETKPKKLSATPSPKIKPPEKPAERGEFIGLPCGDQRPFNPFSEARSIPSLHQRDVEKRQIVQGKPVNIAPSKSILPSVTELLNA